MRTERERETWTDWRHMAQIAFDVQQQQHAAEEAAKAAEQEARLAAQQRAGLDNMRTALRKLGLQPEDFTIEWSWALGGVPWAHDAGSQSFELSGGRLYLMRPCPRCDELARAFYPLHTLADVGEQVAGPFDDVCSTHHCPETPPEPEPEPELKPQDVAECAGCHAVCRPWDLYQGHCEACNRLVPLPLTFARVAEDPGSAAAEATGEAGLWLLHHGIPREQIISAHVSTTVGGVLDKYRYSFTLTLMVEVPRHLIIDHSTDLSDIPIYDLVEVGA